MKKVKRNSIIVLLITVLLLFFILRGNFKSTMSALINTNILLLIVAIFCYFISYVFDSLSYYYVILQYKKNYKLSKAFRLNILTKFFNGITPLASGGQPLQLYELHKDNVKMHDATTIVIQFYVIYQIAMVFISTLSVIFLVLFKIIPLDAFVRHMLAFGYIANLVILFVLLFISLNRNASKTLVRFVISILSKLHIVKNREEKQKKWDKNCEDFYNSAQLMLKNKKTFIRGIGLQALQILFCYIVPLFIVYAMGIPSTLNAFNTIIASAFVFLAGCYIPIPGATGGMEFGFLKFFGPFVKEKHIHALIIIWRFITYILPVFIGGIVFNIRSKKDNGSD